MEKNIIKQLINIIKELISDEIHRPDIDYITVLSHYCSKIIFEKRYFISEDKGIIKNKSKIENKFPLIEIISVENFNKI
jgi:hypothetical protein